MSKYLKIVEKKDCEHCHPEKKPHKDTLFICRDCDEIRANKLKAKLAETGGNIWATNPHDL